MFPQFMNQTQTVANETQLAAHMRMIFNYMTGGVALAGITGWLTLQNQEATMVAAQSGIILFLVWFGVGMFFHKIAFSVQPATALLFFALFSALTGFMFAPVMLAYAQTDITLAFFAAAGTFLAASVYGYTTNRSLASLGSFLAVGGIALIIFMVVLLVMGIFGGGVPAGLSLVFSLLVVPFVTLAIAYKMNQIRESFHQYSADELTTSRLAIIHALGFFTDFAVLFLHLLRIIGAARN